MTAIDLARCVALVCVWIYIDALKANPMQVELEVDLSHGAVIAPAGLLGYENRTEDGVNDLGTSLFLDLPELQVHLRLHDYFMGGWLQHRPDR